MKLDEELDPAALHMSFHSSDLEFEYEHWDEEPKYSREVGAYVMPVRLYDPEDPIIYHGLMPLCSGGVEYNATFSCSPE